MSDENTEKTPFAQWDDLREAWEKGLLPELEFTRMYLGEWTPAMQEALPRRARKAGGPSRFVRPVQDDGE